MDQSHPICRTCGVQYEAGPAPARCPICADDRQYVPPAGQQWTSIETLVADGFRNRWAPEEHGLLGIGTEPRFAIGQRAGNVRFWSGDAREVLPGRTLYRAGIHFAGGTILHWPAGADGRGALLTGDIFQVVEDRRWISFMYSYPNYIPEHPDTIRRAVELVDPLDFAVIYAAWWGKVLTDDAKGAVV